MRVYLVRHGEAKNAEEDPSRGLSDRGRSDVKKVAAFMAASGTAAVRVLHSDKQRALETAEIIAAAVRPAKGIEETTGLAPLDEPAIWAERVKEDEEDAILVGHLPHMARLAALLICNGTCAASSGSSPPVINFQPATVLCLEHEGHGQWFVQWMVSPEVLS